MIRRLFRSTERVLLRFRRSMRAIGTQIYRQTAGNLVRLAPSRLFRRVSTSTTKVVHQIERSGSNRPTRRWFNLLFAIPALVTCGGVIFVTARALETRRQLGPKFLSQGLKLAAQEDYHGAQIYLTRASEVGGVDTREVEFGLAVVWERLGYTGRSMQIFQRLAPFGKKGYPKGHRHLAMMISLKNQNRKPSNELLSRWYWHLTNSDQQQSAEVQESWGNYYVALDDLQSAIEAYQQAATKYPRLYLAMANLYERLGRLELRAETLRRSKQEYRQRVKADPNDRNARVIFATTLLQLGELVEAEQVLRTGLRLDPDGPYRLLLAATFVKLFDKLMEKGGRYQADALQQLRHALEFDPNFSPALNRLLGFAQLDPAAIPEMRDMLKKVLATGRGTALAHLALSNLAWLEDDKTDLAAFHLEQAMAMDAKMPVIANNLAWLLAHGEPPDYERSLRIAQAVVEDFPDNPRFLDTRGNNPCRNGETRGRSSRFRESVTWNAGACGSASQNRGGLSQPGDGGNRAQSRGDGGTLVPSLAVHQGTRRGIITRPTRLTMRTVVPVAAKVASGRQIPCLSKLKSPTHLSYPPLS